MASSATTKIHPSASEPVLGARGVGEKREQREGEGETGSETTVRDAFQRLSLEMLKSRPHNRTGE